MTTRFWMSSIITVLVVLGCLTYPLIPQTTLPFDIRPGEPGQFMVSPSSVGLPMPADLRAGDTIDYVHMDTLDRLVFETNVGNQPVGTVITLKAIRGGHTVDVPVTIVADHKAGEDLFICLMSIALLWLYAALGLLLLWRGVRQAAMAVCLWCMLTVFSTVLTNLSLPLLWGAIVGQTCNDVVNIGTLVALYLLADDLTQGGISRQTRTRMRYAMVAAVSIYTLGVVASELVNVVYGVLLPYFRLVVVFHLVAFSIPLGLLSFSYGTTPAAERARVRWVLASIVLYIASYLAQVFGIDFLDNLQASLVITALTGAAFLGFTYAVLRHRLVSLRFVLNRALVYGAITSLVVGIFAAISAIVEHFAIGRTESALLQLLVPLTLGVTLNMVKKRLDALVERFFFQRQFQAEAALSRFARECGFIENLDTLLDRASDEVFEHLRATGVALFEGAPSGYVRLRQRGSRQFPPQLSVDDPALVSLRASLADADLDKLKSALGSEGLVFPLAVRGTLAGMLVIGQRPAEQYTHNERALLAQLAAQVAAAMHALRAKEAEAFVDAVARGALPAAPETRSRAREVLNQQLATAAS
jgi:hypothetical protein